MMGSMFGGGQCSCTYDNEAQTQEMAVQVSGGSAENQLSGVLVNRIPRTGGNTFSGDFVTLFANDSLQSQTLDDETAEEYEAEFNRNVAKRLPRFALEIENR